MNKFAVIATLAALAAIASAVPVDRPNSLDNEEEVSMLSVIPGDDEEVMYLKGDQKILSDFCVNSRDLTRNWMNDKANSATSSLFNALFTEFIEAGTEILKENAAAISEATDLIKESTVFAPTEEKIDKETAVEQVKENGEVVEKVGLLKSITVAMRKVLTALVDTAASQFGIRLARLRELYSGEELKLMFQDACQAISYDLKGKLEDFLRKSKVQMSRVGGKELSETIKGFRLESVDCVTSKRVIKIAAVCDIYKIAGPALYTLLGW